MISMNTEHRQSNIEMRIFVIYVTTSVKINILLQNEDSILKLMWRAKKDTYICTYVTMCW